MSYSFEFSIGRDRITAREPMVSLDEAKRTIEKMMIVKKPKAERTHQEKMKIVRNKNRSLVFCLETGDSFPSAAQAAECMGIEKEKIFAALRGKVNQADGYRFEYRKRPPCKRSVRCIETGAIYESIEAAGRAFGVSGDAIRTAIAREWKSCGYRWQYAD
jgi:hypothetical protein